MGIRANTYAEATIIDGLSVKTELSFDYGITNTYKFDPSYTFGAIENTNRVALTQSHTINIGVGETLSITIRFLVSIIFRQW